MFNKTSRFFLGKNSKNDQIGSENDQLGNTSCFRFVLFLQYQYAHQEEEIYYERK